MADFFEQLGKKISDVAEDFGKKDGRYPGVQRIKKPDSFSGSCQ